MRDDNDGEEDPVEAKGESVPVSQVYSLLIEQIRTNNHALASVQASHVEVREMLAIAKTQLESGAKAFDAIRKDHGSLEERLRKVEQDKICRAECDGKHSRGGDTAWKIVGIAITVASVAVAIIAVAIR
jgi:hypothetical protein